MGRPKKSANSSPSFTSKKIHGLEGSFDALSQTQPLWELILRRLSKVARTYGFYQIETPILEDSRLYENFYKNQEGPYLNMVSLEIDGKAVSARPSILPSVLRSYYQYKIYEKAPASKWWYKGITAKKTQDGKALESAFEYGMEIFGTFTHLAEAQAIGAEWEFLKSLDFGEISLEINSIGEEECQRMYSDNLVDFISSKKYDLCDACNESLKGRPLDIFRCDNLDCQAIVSEAPAILDFLDQSSSKHFTNILEALDELRIPYQLNPLYVGPSGHSRTNFVIKYKDKGQSKVLVEGGYHDSYMRNLCGKNLCCFGFTGSLNLIYSLLELAKISVEQSSRVEVFLVPLGELAAKKSLRLFRDLTNEKIVVYDHFGEGGVKNQLKQAETYKAPVALILGQKEAMEEMVILRDVKSGMQEIISYDKIVEEVKKRLGK